MKEFMDRDFLLSSETAKELFHRYAEPLPIVDYHCHIDPGEIARNRKFDNIAQLWLGGDHYKWKLMRSNGVEEKYITGDGSDREKFQAYAEALPKAVGNPLYHWTHLELRTYFGYSGVLNGGTAEEVWNLCNEKLKTDALSVRGILKRSDVRLICTTDDPVDPLDAHQRIREDPSCAVKVLPAWRPDKILNPAADAFPAYVRKLCEVSGVAVGTFAGLCEALKKRLDFFESMGCRASDHGLDEVVCAPAPRAEVDSVLRSALEKAPLSPEKIDEYRYAVLSFLAGEYAERGWVMQLHFGADRNVNTAMYKKLGPDTGFDCIAPPTGKKGLTRFLDSLFRESRLPKTILYSLNPNDNLYLDSVIGCFQGTGAAGKLQHGAAWWFNDTRDGIVDQMTRLASLSLLGNFVGMLTDSRSFTSYPRHEYFRRILCNLIGGWVENGEYPDDPAALKKLVQDISYYNAVRYFGFSV